MADVAVAVSILLLLFALLATGVLIAMALRMPSPVEPGQLAPAPSPRPRRARAYHDDITPQPERGRVRLMSRLLFARRTSDAITLDCTLVAVEGQLPPDVDPPQGLPFTLRLRCPDTTWFAGRVEELLTEWAEENRELMLELSPDRGKVRTTIASGGSSVHLELAGAAGLGSGLSAA
ncbi:MAG TPA: hypothetical protein VM345_03470 [Acidimicrobiales bacterium]|nr:hypothetical protein [Acidimicrobiales bacterium]